MSQKQDTLCVDRKQRKSEKKMLSLFPYLLLGCKDSKTQDTATEEVLPPVYLKEGTPVAGVAEGPIDVPVGSPMGGYSNRCTYLGGASKVDRRKNHYTQAWSPSAGIHTTAMAEVLWLENDDQNWVLINIDAIYVFDEMVKEVERQLSQATGEIMDNRVVISASHTHHAPANFSDQIHFYLGGDRYNEEIFQRYTQSIVALSLEAYENREAANIGFGVAKDWDPDDLVYKDRRSENNDLTLWDDFEGGDYKDPYLWMMKINRATDDSPMGIFFNFGIHGTSLGDDNPLISVDAPGHLEFPLRERFDQPIVVSHFQGGGGDISPGGTNLHGHSYARMEGIGEFAVDSLYALWETIPTSNSPITMESVSRAIPQSLEEIKVTRNGTVDWYYAPYEEDRVPDNQVYDSAGNLLSPIDEFNAPFGGVFCGYDDPLVPTGNVGAGVYPYDGCMRVDMVVDIIKGVFSLNDFFPEGIPMPLPSSLDASTSSVRIGPVSVRKDDGSVVEEDVMMGFFPGEATSYYVKHYRDRVQNEIGFENVIAGGYAQDHEGYLLIPEDWLVGGYEANINIWGPLQGEHIMEGNLEMSMFLTTDEVERHDPDGLYQTTEYTDRWLPMKQPDSTPLAGTDLEELVEDFFIPLPVEAQLQPSAEMPRVQGLAQFSWQGGDPAVDAPLVTIEREEDGEWVELKTPSGRLISEKLPDILLTHTPTPLYPADAEQEHHWWAGWQTVGTLEKMGLPAGNYRFHVYGHRYPGGNDCWPWDKEEYDIVSAEFVVTPAELQLEKTGLDLWVSLPGPEWGFRLIDMNGSSHGDNPPIGVSIELEMSDGSISTPELIETLDGSRIHFMLPETDSEPVVITATDIYGNTGHLDLDSGE